VRSAKTAEPTEMPFGMWIMVARRNHVLDGGSHAWTCPAVDILKATQQRAALVWCECQAGCTRRGADWHHLANTSEPSVCGGDAALYQITLTTCFIFAAINFKLFNFENAQGSIVVFGKCLIFLNNDLIN